MQNRKIDRSGRPMLTAAAIATAAAACSIGSPVGRAASLNDVASGAWDAAATWGGSVPASGDELTLDSHTVTISKALGATITGNYTLNLGGDGVNGKLALIYDTTVPGAATLNFNGGGTIENSRGTIFSGGLTWNVAGITTYYTNSATEYSAMGSNGTLATSTIMTGSGTIKKTGPGNLAIRSALNIQDNDPVAAGNQSVVNASTFSGTYDVQAGVLEPAVAEFTKFATVNLGGTVAGTIAGYSPTPTAAQMDDAPRLNYAGGGTVSTTQLEVKNLTGTGRVSWNNTQGYYRDVAIGTLIDPGTATEAGLIKRHTAGAKNDLVMRPGSTMAFDVFGATAADADQIDWTDSTNVSGIVFDEAHIKVRLFTPDASLSGLSWTLINGDDWILKSAQDDATPAAVASQTFLTESILAADGGTLDLWDLSAGDSGWYDLDIEYGGSAGNRQVILKGSYHHAVPEPAALAAMGVTAGGLLLGRRRGGRERS